MHLTEPQIGRYIVPCQATIRPEANASQALFLMRRLGTRYLPVRRDGKIVGILKEDRVRAAVAEPSTRHLSVSALMGAAPATVSPDASLFQVLDETSESTYGCTVVQNPTGEVAGIFSALDAVIAFKRLLAEKRWA